MSNYLLIKQGTIHNAIEKEPFVADILVENGKIKKIGPVVGHVSPEAAAGGPIAFVEEGDLIELDVENRRLAIVGVKGEEKTGEEIAQILEERKKNWKGFTSKYKSGLLKLYAQHATSAMKGAYMD